jgi:hypothetical protein
VAAEQVQEFCLKIALTMVLILIANIVNDRILFGPAHAECGISFLPAKNRLFGKVWRIQCVEFAFNAFTRSAIDSVDGSET